MPSPALQINEQQKAAVQYMKGLILLAVAICFSPGSGADVPPSQTAEVEHLITYLRDSDCRMIRNGKSHGGINGAKHVQRKYDYFRNEISSTEEFIGYAATKSTTSGRSYEVQCPGEEPVPSSDWLLDELEVYRALHREFSRG